MDMVKSDQALEEIIHGMHLHCLNNLVWPAHKEWYSHMSRVRWRANEWGNSSLLIPTSLK